MLVAVDDDAVGRYRNAFDGRVVRIEVEVVARLASAGEADAVGQVGQCKGERF